MLDRLAGNEAMKQHLQAALASGKLHSASIISDLHRLASKPALLRGFSPKDPVFCPVRLLFFGALWYTGSRFMKIGFHRQVLFPDGRRCFFGQQ